jgi:7,8-dihydropterin-6-yl-methyl-4-(beta-D-ribofuranosyl)aminobenzene 5'-phosphate synthase
LSHGHYDHTGGLVSVRRAAPDAKIFCHPKAFFPKYARMKDGTSRYIGAPSASLGALRRQGSSVVATEKPTEITAGLFVTGEIPRVTDFEDTGGPFFLDENCTVPDPLVDDQGMFFETPRGTVVILGCAHSGVVNTLRYVRQLTNNKPIHAVLGGLHLVWAAEERVSRTIQALREFGVDRLGIAHCTGFEASGALLTSLPGKCHACTAGTVVEF